MRKVLNPGKIGTLDLNGKKIGTWANGSEMLSVVRWGSPLIEILGGKIGDEW